jgi:4-methylaminobutanoate oxidase (formaldehyde-forming)
LNEGKIIGRTTSGNYSFNYKKNMAFGYINSDLELNMFIDKSLEIEVEKTRYESSIEMQPLHDPENTLLKC